MSLVYSLVVEPFFFFSNTATIAVLSAASLPSKKTSTSYTTTLYPSQKINQRAIVTSTDDKNNVSSIKPLTPLSLARAWGGAQANSFIRLFSKFQDCPF